MWRALSSSSARCVRRGAGCGDGTVDGGTNSTGSRGALKVGMIKAFPSLWALDGRPRSLITDTGHFHGQHRRQHTAAADTSTIVIRDVPEC